MRGEEDIYENVVYCYSKWYDYSLPEDFWERIPYKNKITINKGSIPERSNKLKKILTNIITPQKKMSDYFNS